MSARRPWAWPLVPLYAAALAVKGGMRTTGMLKCHKLQWPVVSVGSLSAGGAGKTPVVMALAESLREHGWAVDVLSRGYGREGRGLERVDPDIYGAAKRFGDEPVMMARRLGVPVWVGNDRFAAGLAAEASATPRAVHLLDDGFQHRGLARSMDVVLVTAADLEDVLLPAGNLREPLSVLWQADAVVVREEEWGRVEPRVRRLIRQNAAIWAVRRTLELPQVTDPQGSSKGLIAFCAIARPEDFVEALRTGGVKVIRATAFPDHHAYAGEDMRRLTETCRSLGGDAFITTEKDAVKLTPELRECLEATAPLLVARLQTAFVDPAQILRELEARLT